MLFLFKGYFRDNSVAMTRIINGNIAVIISVETIEKRWLSQNSSTYLMVCRLLSYCWLRLETTFLIRVLWVNAHLTGKLWIKLLKGTKRRLIWFLKARAGTSRIHRTDTSFTCRQLLLKTACFLSKTDSKLHTKVSFNNKKEQMLIEKWNARLKVGKLQNP